MESTFRMKVDSTEKDLIISIPRDIIDVAEVQWFIDFIRYRVLVSKSQATDEDIDKLVDEINSSLAERKEKDSMMY
jgi:hypothetical protein